MPRITLNSAEPRICGLLRYRPETGRPLSELAEVLLRGPGTLTAASSTSTSTGWPRSHRKTPLSTPPGPQRLIKEGYLPPAEPSRQD